MPGARAWIQAHCQINRRGEKSVCSEQISFFLTGRSPGLLRNVVFAHLDSDLPLAFWWRGEFSDAFEERLYSRIDRLLFGSDFPHAEGLPEQVEDDAQPDEEPRRHHHDADDEQDHQAAHAGGGEHHEERAGHRRDGAAGADRGNRRRRVDSNLCACGD